MNTLSEEQKRSIGHLAIVHSCRKLGRDQYVFTLEDLERLLADELARERERIIEAYQKSGIVIEYLATSGGKLFAKLDSDIPAVVSFIDDTKFRSLISKAAEKNQGEWEGKA